MIKRLIKTWKARVILIIAVGGVGYFVYTQCFKVNSSTTSYQTAFVQKGTLVESVTASGSVSTANNTPVVTQITGTITKLYVKSGDKVNAGDPIATVNLDRSSTQKYIQQTASYQNAVNNLQSAKDAYTSLRATMVSAQESFTKNALNKGLSKNNPNYIILNDNMKTAENKYEAQDAVVIQAQTSLNAAALSLQQFSPTIVAPISGTITGLSLQEGSVIPAQAISSSTNTISQNVATITTSNFPIISIDLTEIDIPKVQIGQKATVTFDAFPDKTYSGKVFSINTTGTSSSGVTTYPTTIILDTENPQIYANMSASASVIITTKDNVMYAPVAAVQTTNGQSTVRVLKDNKVTNVNVVTGISSDTNTEIVSGLNEGDEVVTAVTTASNSTSATGVTSVFGIRTGAGGRNFGH